MAAVVGRMPTSESSNDPSIGTDATGTRQAVCDICERLRPGLSSDQQDVFDAGGNPSLFERLRDDLRRTFGFLAEGLPFGDVANNPTIEWLTQSIDANLQSVSSPLVSLQPRGSRAPLFLIHAGGGYVSFYRALASRLGPDYPVHGVQAAASTGHRPVLHESDTIGDVATRYLDVIRSVQPRGPYAIGGASLGGAIALEMCRQLKAQGEVVAPPFLFSALLDEGSGAPPVGLPDRLVRHVGHAARLGGPEALRYVSTKIAGHAASEARVAIQRARRGLRAMSAVLGHEWIAASHRPTRQAIPPALIYRCAANLKHGARLLARYTPEPYAARIVLFSAAADMDVAPRWSHIAGGQLDVHEMPGGHLEMMEEPAVRHTADTLRLYLDAHLT